MPAAVHAVSGTDMHAQFDNAFANWLAVAKIARRHLEQTDPNASLSDFVAQCAQPFREWFASIFALIPKQFDHRQIVA